MIGRGIFIIGFIVGLMAGIVHAEDTQVFAESTSFENLLANRKNLERKIASMTVSARVIALRRELGLNSRESDQAPQDIILNAGTENGISEGMLLTVQRRIPILDPYRDNQQTELEVEFATLRIVSAQNDLAVARVEKMDSIQQGLALGTRGIMIGDYVGKSAGR